MPQKILTRDMLRMRQLKTIVRYRAAYRRKSLINPVILFVSRFGPCLQFYTKVFDLKLLHRKGEWAELDAGGLVLSLHGGYRGGSVRQQKPLALHFTCMDIKRTAKLVQKYGGRMVQQPRLLDFRPDELVTALEAKFLDPDGNEFELRQVVSVG